MLPGARRWPPGWNASRFPSTRSVPTSVPGVEPHILYPVKTWASKGDFAETAKRLVQMFRENFRKFEGHVDDSVKAAAPSMAIAA